MENEVLLNKLYEKIFKLNHIFKSFYENDFNKLGSSDFKNTVKSLNSFLFKSGYINNGIMDCYSSKNFYAIQILRRTLIEAYFKHLYIYARSLKDNNDTVGSEYLNILKSSEDLSAIRLVNNYIKESNNTLNKTTTSWSTGGENNKDIENIGKNFEIKQICHYLLTNIVGEDSNENLPIKEVFRDDFFKKYIKEYSNLSSFTHVGPFSDAVFNEFNKQDNKQIILDNLLKDSFDLYLNIVNTTFLFYSLMNTELEKYYKEVNGIHGI